MSQGKIFNWADVESWPSDDRYPGISAKVVNGKNMQLSMGRVPARLHVPPPLP